MKTSATISVELAAKLDAVPRSHPALADKVPLWRNPSRSERLQLLLEYALRDPPKRASVKKAKR